MPAEPVRLTHELRGLLDRALDADDLIPTKQKVYEEIGIALVNSGIPKREVAREGLRLLEDRLWERRRSKGEDIPREAATINRSHWYDTMSKMGCTDPAYARHVTEKETDPDTGSKNSSTPETIAENAELIRHLDDVSELIARLRAYCTKGPFASLVDPADLSEVLQRLSAWTRNWGDYMNNKQTVPTNAQHIFLSLTNAAGSVNEIFGMLFDEVKRIHVRERTAGKASSQIITNKELKKLKARDIVGLCPNLEPQDANEARLNGFYGQQCPRCKGFRTRPHRENASLVECMRCRQRGDSPPIKREPMALCPSCRLIITPEDSKFVSRKGMCPHCRNEVILPVGLQ